MSRIRFYPEYRTLTIWQSLVSLVKNRKWIRSVVIYRSVYEGQPGYDDAPYECGVIEYKPKMVLRR